MAVNRPNEVNDIGPQILPASLVLFQGLKRAYASMYISFSSLFFENIVENHLKKIVYNRRRGYKHDPKNVNAEFRHDNHSLTFSPSFSIY